MRASRDRHYPTDLSDASGARGRRCFRRQRARPSSVRCSKSTDVLDAVSAGITRRKRTLSRQPVGAKGSPA
jgi:hypothetical protein